MAIADLSQHVSTGPLSLAVPIALVAGAVSFASPCVLPLVPGYLSIVAGIAGSKSDAGTRRRRRRTSVIGAALFVAGFSIVFVSLGAAFGGIGQALQDDRATLQVIFGLVAIVLGLALCGVLARIPGLRRLNDVALRDLRIHRLPNPGLIGAPFMGILFGLGWSPCIGPTLSSVLGLAASQNDATALRGAVLAAVYCAGLGIPFLAIAALAGNVSQRLKPVRRLVPHIAFIAGIILIGIGALEVVGAWSTVVSWLQANIGGSTAWGI